MHQAGGGRVLLRRWLSRRALGQPTAHTHPGLLKEGEILPGIDRSEFSKRRLKLMQALSKSHTGMKHPRHLAVVPAAPIKYRYSHIPYQFHQNPDFLYFTGFMEPDAVLLLVSDETKGLPHHRSILYVQPRHAQREQWGGPRTGPEDAVEFLGVDEAHSIENLEAHLLSQYAPMHYAVWHYSTCVVNGPLQKTVAMALGKQKDSKIKGAHNIVPYMDAVKAIKSSGEVELLRRACHIAGHAFREAMAACHPGAWEYQLESVMEHAARMRGAWSLSFPPVVGGGARGNHIHYIRNDQQLIDGELVLVDAGVDYHGYMSDITRTWPVNGRFTPAQRDLYCALLEVQERAVKNCKPGVSLNYLHHQTTLEIGQMLKVLEIASPRAKDESLSELSEILFPHHLGHYLGVEIHDTPSVSRSLQLLPGMVVTVEPGVYLAPDFTSHLLGPKAEHFKGMAIRIEDNVLLTDSGNEVLSACSPKKAEEIEALVGTAPSP